MERLLSFCTSDQQYPVPYEFSFTGKGQPSPQAKSFENNFVRTSKYTMFSFLPKALILQFKRIANVYFLIVAILCSIPIISPMGPFIAWTPLIIVIGLSMIREGYQDYQRFKSDRKLNYETVTQIKRGDKFEKVPWSQVQIGDICLVQQQQMFPADLLLLSSSDSQNGSVYIQTASLDGQKNLKPRACLKQTMKYDNLETIEKFEGFFKGKIPEKQLHSFSGKLQLKQCSLFFQSDKQLLFRGTRLKNTKFIYGLVIYTGKNTKIMLNSEAEAQKMSQVQRKVNYILVFVFLTQLILCLAAAILYTLFRKDQQPIHDYIQWANVGYLLDGTFIFLSYFVLLNTMIPISLVVSIEFVKMFQKSFINKDKLSYSQYRKRGIQCRTSSLNQQLGQIQYVFTDKTGTLTMNIMEFKLAMIGDKMFGDYSLITGQVFRSSNMISIQKPKQKGFYDDKLFQMIQSGVGQNNVLINPIVVKNKQRTKSIVLETLGQITNQYLTALSITHQVVAEKNQDGQRIYQGPSPDQITLVETAQRLSYQFLRCSSSTTTVRIKGKDKTFELLQSFSFSSDRKRMSVIVRDDKEIRMYTKGADNIIKERLADDQILNLDDQLRIFARIGLRTLLIATRIISEEQYQTFKKKKQQIPSESISKQLPKLIQGLERELYLIGATAVLDQLQEKVPQTIKDLLRANIKVWMLTGDKMQTAQNIAKSCHLIQDHFQLLRFQPNPSTNIQMYLTELIQRTNKLTQKNAQKAFLIEGADLTYILGNEFLQKMLIQIVSQCQAAVCCRLLPKQKKQMVDMVRKYLNKITLAIGDGANDVPMIKSAHIGIGLFGEEGMGAVQASDYALPEFRMLWRLLFVHGRWNYIRISEMILYFFYKNMLFTIPQFIAAFYCAFSAQTIFDGNYITMYNIFFTSLPLIIRAVLQQDVNYIQEKQQPSKSSQNVGYSKKVEKQSTEQLMKSATFNPIPKQYKINKYIYNLFPKIYVVGQQNCIFNYQNYLSWAFQSTVESIIITFLCFYILSQSSINEKGYNTSYWLIGLTIYSSIMGVVTTKLITHVKFWTIWLILGIVFFSVGIYIGYMFLSNQLYAHDITGTVTIFFQSLDCYLIVCFCVCLILAIDGIVVYIDHLRGGKASLIRELINNNNAAHKRHFQSVGIQFSDKMTATESERRSITVQEN